jgi:peptidoglycan/LPS O-acetylase OafA/YrhL
VLGGPFRPLLLALLPVFFALSGFLIAGSMVRVQSFPVFILHPALRIGPA